MDCRPAQSWSSKSVITHSEPKGSDNQYPLPPAHQLHCHPFGSTVPREVDYRGACWVKDEDPHYLVESQRA